ncbi:MAG: thioredoxin domain-containing protein [Brumimicrobium sp.]|nr:thioredoxin domain-containing protein [Brumimicrobium sp.]
MKVFGVLSIVIFFILTSFTWVSSPKADEKPGIKFENITFKDALLKAKKENKLIFMDAYTVWCGPCKFMERTTFRAEKVGEVFNANFINLQVDMEKGEGLEIAKRYQIAAYPTLLVINGDGKVVKRMLGAMDEAELLKEIQEVIKK